MGDTETTDRTPQTDTCSMRQSLTPVLFRAANWVISAVLALAGCTSGDRCNLEHPCSAGDVCFEGICTPGCAEGGDLISVGVCHYPMPACSVTNCGSNCSGRCTQKCTRETEVYGEQGTCIPEMFCSQDSRSNDWREGLCQIRGDQFLTPWASLVECTSDDDCQNAILEVSSK